MRLQELQGSTIGNACQLQTKSIIFQKWYTYPIHFIFFDTVKLQCKNEFIHCFKLKIVYNTDLQKNHQRIFKFVHVYTCDFVYDFLPVLFLQLMFILLANNHYLLISENAFPRRYSSILFIVFVFIYVHTSSPSHSLSLSDNGTICKVLK